ncbi:MAG: hypothetical protein EOO77_40005 [Oxalobacteraceae bacterium]|nr:MAG: hypothetical protein EOO77_40005 [Oxalobacteraceae bacterium]
MSTERAEKANSTPVTLAQAQKAALEEELRRLERRALADIFNLSGLSAFICFAFSEEEAEEVDEVEEVEEVDAVDAGLDKDQEDEQGGNTPVLAIQDAPIGAQGAPLGAQGAAPEEPPATEGQCEVASLAMTAVDQAQEAATIEPEELTAAFSQAKVEKRKVLKAEIGEGELTAAFRGSRGH